MTKKGTVSECIKLEFIWEGRDEIMSFKRVDYFKLLHMALLS